MSEKYCPAGKCECELHSGINCNVRPSDSLHINPAYEQMVEQCPWPSRQQPVKNELCPPTCEFRNKDYCPSSNCQLIPQPRIINGRYPVVDETPAVEPDPNGDMLYINAGFNQGLDAAIVAVEKFMKCKTCWNIADLFAAISALKKIGG